MLARRLSRFPRFRPIALLAPGLVTVGLLAGTPRALAVTYTLTKHEIMLPVNSYCATYTGPSDLGTPSLKWATLDDDITAINVLNEDHLFIYPKGSLLFDAGEVQNATCWYQLPSTFQRNTAVSLVLVGHAPTVSASPGTVDFDIRYKARARDESLGFVAPWSAWMATAPGEMEISIPVGIAGTDLSSRTDPFTLVTPGNADPGDVVQWRVRRNGATDSYDQWFDVDYFMLTFMTLTPVGLP